MRLASERRSPGAVSVWLWLWSSREQQVSWLAGAFWASDRDGPADNGLEARVWQPLFRPPDRSQCRPLGSRSLELISPFVRCQRPPAWERRAGRGAGQKSNHLSAEPPDETGSLGRATPLVERKTVIISNKLAGQQVLLAGAANLNGAASEPVNRSLRLGPRRAKQGNRWLGGGGGAFRRWQLIGPERGANGG